MAERGHGPVRVHCTDGWAYLAETDQRYDVVVVDLPDERPDDPTAQHNRLYGRAIPAPRGRCVHRRGALVGQAGCATLWRNETLLRSIDRFDTVFPAVVHYGFDEHEWSFLTGTRHAVPDPLRRMTDRLATLPCRPATLDAEALRRGAVLPHTARECR